ncbi:hypothetical protein [Pseudarthrobacter sp. NPDC080039]|uniref:hypothetical protein n=1 Tax=unclassified Pseudarthrobacter TaxID=2647000 RepID=UPI00344E1657
MEDIDEPDHQAQANRDAMAEAGIPLNAGWMRYFSFTGVEVEWEIDAYLNGSLPLPVHERDLIAHAVNELIKELPPRGMAPYSTNGTKPPPHLGNGKTPSGSWP